MTVTVHANSGERRSETIEIAGEDHTVNQEGHDPCYPDLPDLNLNFVGTEDYIGSDGNPYTRYRLEVTNSTQIPNALFVPSPDLPPCGSNTNSSRTWVDIYNNNHNRLYRFCALGSSDGLRSLWFALPRGTAPPHSVYIVLRDRLCENNYVSNLATISVGPTCYPNLPDPSLIFVGTEDYIDAFGNEYTRYNLEVTNSDQFPDALFVSSPNLPPCGSNTSASRTWVNIYNNNHNRLYGFCALDSSDGLRSLWFGLPRGTTPPVSVYIELNDRLCEDTSYTSNLVIISYNPYLPWGP